MERSSSQTRMLAMTYLSSGQWPVPSGQQRALHNLTDFAICLGAFQLEDEFRALAGLGAHGNTPIVGLHDLVGDGQAKPGATFEPRLIGLEYLLHLLARHAGAAIGEPNAPEIASGRFQLHR